MLFPLIPAALGVCFVLVWVLVGGMIFRDSQLAARSERNAELNILPWTSSRPGDLPRVERRRSRGAPAARAAS